jgi:hypothetical protein
MAITRSPAEYFIKFLLSQRAHDTNAILRILEDFGLEGLTSRYLDQLRTKMEPWPDPWEAGQVFGATREYLKQQGIHDLWYPSAHVKEAYEILGNPQLRADVEQLLLSPLRIEDVVARLNKHHEISLTVAGVQAFGHYFWNRKLLPMHEWIELMEGRPFVNNHIAVMNVSPDMATSLVPWVMGYSGPPANLNTGTVSKRIRDVAFMKILEIERHPATLAHSKMMKNYSDVVKMAENEMRQSDVALKDVLTAFEKFRLRRDDEPIPSIEEVAGPNYSRSGEGTDKPGRLSDYDWRTDDDDEDEEG